MNATPCSVQFHLHYILRAHLYFWQLAKDDWWLISLMISGKLVLEGNKCVLQNKVEKTNAKDNETICYYGKDLDSFKLMIHKLYSP